MSEFVAYIFHSNVINIIGAIVILEVLLKNFMKKGMAEIIGSFINKKIETISSAVKFAEQQREQAIVALKDAKNRVKNIEEEKKEITSEAQKTADLLKEKISQETIYSLQEIDRNTEKFIDAEQKTLKESMSREVAQEALEIAKEHIKKAINDDMQKKYINDFIENLDEIKV